MHQTKYNIKKNFSGNTAHPSLGTLPPDSREGWKGASEGEEDGRGEAMCFCPKHSL